jgi:hypothetical protein
VLVSSGADILTYGMGENIIRKIATLLDKGVPVSKIRDVRGTVWLGNKGDKIHYDYCGEWDFNKLKEDKEYYAKAFAELFTKEFEKMKDIPNSNKPEEPAYPNMAIRGTKADTELYTNGLAVLNQKESQMPSTLLELGFLSNEKDAFMLQSTYWQNFAAEAIADAVVAAHIAGLYKG